MQKLGIMPNFSLEFIMAYHNSPYRDVNYKTTSEIEIVSPKWTMQDGRLIKPTSQIKNRVIPLETVSPEFDVLTGIRGMHLY